MDRSWNMSILWDTTLACLPFDFLISWLLIESRNASFLEKLAQTFMEYRIALIVQQE